MLFTRIAVNDKLQQHIGYIVSNCTGVVHKEHNFFTIQGAVYTTFFEELEADLMLNITIDDPLDHFLKEQTYA